MRGKVLILALTIVLLLIGSLTIYRILFLRFVRVPTGSMSNTIIPGDHLVVKKRIGTVERGDIIVFKWPKDPSIQYVSRVIGLPGESILIRDMKVFINERELDERRVMIKPEDMSKAEALQELSSDGSGPYGVFYIAREFRAAPDSAEEAFGINEPFRIPANEYFVMGDNRDNSLDSRFWGTVSREAITGKPTMIYLSTARDESGNDVIRWNRMFTLVR